jgi:hypothetical protein
MLYPSSSEALCSQQVPNKGHGSQFLIKIVNTHFSRIFHHLLPLMQRDDVDASHAQVEVAAYGLVTVLLRAVTDGQV